VLYGESREGFSWGTKGLGTKKISLFFRGGYCTVEDDGIQLDLCHLFIFFQNINYGSIPFNIEALYVNLLVN
jgi:hypothetical protein